MNFLENITFRRNRAKSESNTNDENEITVLTDSPLDGTATSLPDISQDEDDHITGLKLQLERLTMELNGAHKEIESLTLENMNLTRLNQELQKQNELYKKVTCSPIKIKPQTPKNKKTRAKANQSKGKHLENPVQCAESSTSVETTILSTSVNNHQQLDKTITDGVNFNTGKLQSDSRMQCKEQKYGNKITKSKICILSTNKTNKVLKIAEDTFPNYSICHYLTPNCGLRNLISNLDLKLKKYTLNDYCIIFIGEEDFHRTQNYVELTINIRETLSKLQHTNIILCAPTFKLNEYSTMFNSRIETFNSLLHLDACTYNYVYLFDSNYYLTYDFAMFRKKSRTVNNRGIANIFRNLSLMISEFTLCDDLDVCNVLYEVPDVAVSISSSNNENEQFFL